MEIWGYGAGIRTRTLDVHILRVRKKLGKFANQYIETIVGAGYRFQPFHRARFQQSIARGLEGPQAPLNGNYIDLDLSLASGSEIAHREVEGGRQAA
jgi:DNA-binding winged helix-turn-helix (wHTH) protein